MANFGFADYDEVTHLGTNGKMSEASAAMGLTSLESMDAFVAHNRENHRRYAQALDGLPGIALVRYDPAERNNYQYVVFEIDENVAGLSRDVLLRVLHGENVLARRYFYPGCHRMEPYRTEFPGAGARLPHTEALAARVLCLPTGTAVDGKAVDGVGEVVRFAATHAAEITARARAAS
jgi:dTDP-4-amino-4,6-dideoxygalactose transaminase